jgi:cytochrome P450
VPGDPDPYANYAWLRENAPVSQTMNGTGGGSVWLVASYELARACLADPRLSNDPRGSSRERRTGLSPGLLSTDHPEHTRLRRAVAGLFSPRAVEPMRAHITRICTAVVDELAARDEAELVAEYAMPVPVAVIYELLGIPVALRMPTRELVRLFRLHGFVEPLDGPAGQLLGAHVAELIEFKRAHPGDDVTTKLVRELDEGRLRHDGELHAVLLSVLGAGHATTVLFLSTALLRLAERPELLAEVLSRPQGWRVFVEELLRFDSPVQLSTNRYATQDMEIGGARIAEGDTVVVSLAAANRDGAQFPDPDRLDLDRGQRGHLTLGHGPHLCLGGHLARIEAEVALAVFFGRLTDVRLRIDPAQVVWTHGPAMRAPREVPATFRVRRGEPS